MVQSLATHGTISLGEVLDGAQFIGARDIRACGCSSDSRSCGPGDVFVAVRGAQADGHDHVGEALARGAASIVAERPVAVDVPVCVVPDTREAFGHLCQALAGRPSRRLRVIGVTGTNGKTTTTQLIAGILREAGKRTGTLGTLGYCDSVDHEPATLTTPDAATLSRWLARMVACDCSHAVMEVSSHAASERRIAGVEFAHVALTNLRRDHLDYHGTLANYHHAKIGLFDHLASDGAAVINVDDPASAEHVPLLPGRVWSIGVQERADLTATVIERFRSEQTILLTAGRITVPVRTAMIGDHHVYNCLVAAAVCLAEGIDLVTIVRGLEAVRHVPGRLERIECGQAYGAFVDYAHTPDALAVSLDTLREVTAGRLICVFGAGGNRDQAKRPLMGRAVEERADIAIVTTDNPRFEDPQSIAAEVMSGFERAGEARWIADRAQAIEYALNLAEPDDCVVVAGRGHEPYQNIGGELLPLDDRDVMRRYLYNLAPGSPYGALAAVGNS